MGRAGERKVPWKGAERLSVAQLRMSSICFMSADGSLQSARSRGVRRCRRNGVSLLFCGYGFTS